MEPTMQVSAQIESSEGPVTALSDRELVNRAMAGDKEALSTLLQRYRPVVMRHLQRYPVDDADRKDLKRLREALQQGQPGAKE